MDERKRFYLPGQKYPTPDDDDGLRIFYESLLAERPECQMALRYCIEHGLLDREVAGKIIEIERGERQRR